MARLADRRLEGCVPCRLSLLMDPNDLDQQLREMVLAELNAPTSPDQIDEMVKIKRSAFLQTEPVVRSICDPLESVPVFGADDVAIYYESLSLETEMTDVVASMAPPFEKFF